jgi:hypothetical protein
MRKTLLICVLGVAGLVVFTSIASAHILSFNRARNATEAAASDYCDSFATCTHYGSGRCVRGSAHRIRCVGIVRDQAGGFCRWPVLVKMRRDSFRLNVISNPRQTQVCGRG